MKLYEYARQVNKFIKRKKKEDAGKYLSPVRRIERFSPVSDSKYVAMTFDDGPMNLPPNPLNKNYREETSLTRLLVEIMEKYKAFGTFNIIGTTKSNYPDREGKISTVTWGGVNFDHYPQYGMDHLAGAIAQKDLVNLLVNKGHELSNHAYSHVLFGPNKIVYGRRHHFKNINNVVNDLNILHEFIEKEFNYRITLSRPPHYIDRIPDGYNSYDAYAALKYDYLAASFDGGGWMPTSGDYELDVDKMVKPLEKTLIKNKDALNGQIIFQKDGYNMSKMTPVAHALDKQLNILSDYGYKVISVSELRKISPFEDIDVNCDYIESLRSLDQKGFVIGYKNNTFKPDQVLTLGEMYTMTLTKDDYQNFVKGEILNSGIHKGYKKHPYYVAYYKYKRLNEMSRFNEKANSEDVKKFFNNVLKKDIQIPDKNEIYRREYLCLIWDQIIKG